MFGKYIIDDCRVQSAGHIVLRSFFVGMYFQISVKNSIEFKYWEIVLLEK